MDETQPATRSTVDENRRLRRAISLARSVLGEALEQLQVTAGSSTVDTVAQVAREAMGEAIRCLEAVKHDRWKTERAGDRSDVVALVPNVERPTRQQGQFLAFIQEYILRNNARMAPSFSDLQRFFNVTAPTVNSMLKRLEEKGFIRREPGKARSIELTIDVNLIPDLERPFKFR